MSKYTKKERKLIKAVLDFYLHDDIADLRYCKCPDGRLMVATRYMALWLSKHPFDPQRLSQHVEIPYDRYMKVLKTPDTHSQEGLVADMQTTHDECGLKHHLFAYGPKLEKKIRIQERMLRRIPYNPDTDQVYIAEPDPNCPLSFYGPDHHRYAVIAPLRTGGEED